MVLISAWLKAATSPVFKGGGFGFARFQSNPRASRAACYENRAVHAQFARALTQMPRRSAALLRKLPVIRANLEMYAGAMADGISSGNEIGNSVKDPLRFALHVVEPR